MEYKEKRNFLLIGHNYIGDVLMLTPAIRALRLKFPESKIFIIVSKNSSAVLKRNSDVNEIIEIDRRKFKGIFGFKAIIALFFKLRRINKKNGGKFYACINFLTSFKFTVLGFLVSKKQIGEEKKINNIFLHDKIKIEKNLHNSDKSIKLIEPFYIRKNQRYSDNRYVYEVSGNDIINGKKILKNSFKSFKDIERSNFNIESNNLEAKNNPDLPADFKFALFSPGSTRKTKEANYRIFSLFADFLNEKGFHVLLTGSKNDEYLCKNIYKEIKNKNNSSNITGLTDIYTIGGLVALSSLVVTVDNGIMHMASALDVNLIALFGSTDPAICGPFVSEKSFVIDKKQGCFHCFGNDCLRGNVENFIKYGFPDCMGLITLEDLKKGFEELCEKK